MIKKVSITVGIIFILLALLSTLTTEQSNEDCKEVLGFYDRVALELSADHDETVTFMALVLYAERDDLERTLEDVEESLEKILTECS